MGEDNNAHPISASAIDGFLEVTLGAMYAGFELTDQSRGTLDIIEDHEETLLEEVSNGTEANEVASKPESRKEVAQFHLGQIAAINALLDIEKPDRKVGF